MGKLSPLERVTAKGVALTTRHNWLRRILAGPQGERVTWIDFDVAETPADRVSWTQFRGYGELKDRKARSLWPVGILAVNGATLSQARANNPDAEVGFAWRLDLFGKVGKAALVGLIPPDDLPAAGEDLLFGAGIGPNGLAAASVLVQPDRELVTLPPSNELPPYVDHDYIWPKFVPDHIPIY